MKKIYGSGFRINEYTSAWGKAVFPAPFKEKEPYKKIYGF